MRSQMMFAAAVVLSLAAAPAFASPSHPNDGQNQGSPTVETPSNHFSGYGEGYQPGTDNTAAWCRRMAASGQAHGQAYAAWCHAPRTHG